MLPVKRAIMILLSLMVGLVLVVSWLMASANLEFAEKAMAQLRQRQIADTFYANLDRINAHHRLMAQSTAGLARAGSLMPRPGEERREVTPHVDGIPKVFNHDTFPGPFNITSLLFLNDVQGEDGGGT